MTDPTTQATRVGDILNDISVEIIEVDVKNKDHEQGHIDALDIIAKWRERLGEESLRAQQPSDQTQEGITK